MPCGNPRRPRGTQIDKPNRLIICAGKVGRLLRMMEPGFGESLSVIGASFEFPHSGRKRVLRLEAPKDCSVPIELLVVRNVEDTNYIHSIGVDTGIAEIGL